MESLDLIDLKTRAHSGRLAIHMAGALPTGLATGKPARRLPPLWRGWMHLALLSIATTALALALLWAWRHGL